MIWHVVEEVCKDEAVEILGENKYDTKFLCMHGVVRDVSTHPENKLSLSQKVSTITSNSSSFEAPLR